MARVFKKAGRYIFNLGFVNFFEYLIVNLLLVIRCYYSELDQLEDIQRSNEQDKKLNYLASHVS